MELLAATQELFLQGPPVQAAGWRRHAVGRHSVALRVSSFRGTFEIEGTLRTDPEQGGWFPVIEPLVFPRQGVVGETATIGLTFQVNCVWLRARVDRRSLVLPGTRPEFIARMVGRFEGARLFY